MQSSQNESSPAAAPPLGASATPASAAQLKSLPELGQNLQAAGESVVETGKQLGRQSHSKQGGQTKNQNPVLTPRSEKQRQQGGQAHGHQRKAQGQEERQGKVEWQPQGQVERQSQDHGQMQQGQPQGRTPRPLLGQRYHGQRQQGTPPSQVPMQPENQRGTPQGLRHRYPQTQQGVPQVHGERQQMPRRPHVEYIQRQPQSFEPYLDQEALQQGLKRGEMIQGPLRINPKSYQDGYVPHPDGKSDVYICGLFDRNRALNGDVVCVQLYSQEQWKIPVDAINVLAQAPGGLAGPGDLVPEAQALSPLELEGLGSPLVADPVENPASSEVLDDSLQVTGATSLSLNQTDALPSVQDLNLMESTALPVKQDSAQTENSDTNQIKEIVNGAACQEIRTPVKTGSDQTKAGFKDRNDSPRQANNCNKQQQQQRTRNGPANRNRAYSTNQTQQQAERYATLQDVPVALRDRVPASIVIKTGKIVAIAEPKHSRACTGNIRPMKDGNRGSVLFAPVDHRMPRLHVPTIDCPPGFLDRPDDFKDTLFVARLVEWKEVNHAIGELCRSLGEAGEIEPESEGFLIEHGIDYSEFSEVVLADLPQILPYQIAAEEIDRRKDLREECIFTIDPVSARDLDDSLSCVLIRPGVYRVGVHIADVSYFVKPGTKLDETAASRSTSVYLVQKYGNVDDGENSILPQVIPMLPRLLCEELCSLNPNQDRLTFSVIWDMTEEGEILEEWFGRSVIRSCVKLGYNHAQGFIEDPDREWTETELPVITGGFTSAQVRDTVLTLNKIAVSLRKKRFDGGALRLDQVKLQFTLNKETGMPTGWSVYQQQDSNRLVEEFMLLANMAVAHKIHSKFPDLAVLRRHPSPQSRMLDELLVLCDSLGIQLDSASAGSLQRSLSSLMGEDDLSRAKLQVLVALCSKPMQMARYFCAGALKEEEQYWHYALNVPLYTHFTSPIRRYPDILVHRLLAAALDLEEWSRSFDVERLSRLTEHSNDLKTASKRVQELSADLFFSIFVKECGPIEEVVGTVMSVLDKSFDVLILQFGVIKRVYCEQLPLVSWAYNKQSKPPSLDLVWATAPRLDPPSGRALETGGAVPEGQRGGRAKGAKGVGIEGAGMGSREGVRQTVTIFTRVQCSLVASDLLLKWNLEVRKPMEE